MRPVAGSAEQVWFDKQWQPLDCGILANGIMTFCWHRGQTNSRL